jgi:hypothetical protein
LPRCPRKWLDRGDTGGPTCFHSVDGCFKNGESPCGLLSKDNLKTGRDNGVSPEQQIIQAPVALRLSHGLNYRITEGTQGVNTFLLLITTLA